MYQSDQNYNSSTSAAVAQTVNVATTSLNLTSSANPGQLNQGIVLTATVSTPASSISANGSVSFYYGSTLLGTANLNGVATDQATYSISTFALGSHNLSAVYAGNTNYTSSSGLLTETINQEAPTVVLTSSALPAAFAASVTFTAAINSPSWGGPTPTGTVIFKDGATQVASVTLAQNSRVASFSTSTLSVGTHTITATYGGDSTYSSASSTAFTETINKAATSTSLSSSLNPSAFGQPVTLTATVAGTSGAPAPTGTVTFSTAAGTLGTATLNGNATSDQATLILSSLAPGSYAITATYAGDGNYSGSSNSFTLTQNVNKANASLALTSSLNPSLAGQSVTFSVTATSGTGVGTPTGTLTLTYYYFGTVQIGWRRSSTARRRSRARHFLSAESIQASYSGDTNFYSASTNITQTVNKAHRCRCLLPSRRRPLARVSPLPPRSRRPAQCLRARCTSWTARPRSGP